MSAKSFLRTRAESLLLPGVNKLTASLDSTLSWLLSWHLPLVQRGHTMMSLALDFEVFYKKQVSADSSNTAHVCTNTFSCLKNYCPFLFWVETSNFTWLRGKLEEGTFGAFMNCILLVKLLLVIMETVCDLNGMPETTLMESLGLTCSLIYVAVALVSLSAHSWEH